MSGMYNLPPYDELVDQIQSLPSIGRRSAEKIAYHIIEMSEPKVDKLLTTIERAHSDIHKCQVCGNYTDKTVCPICTDTSRDQSVICVVTRPRDIMVFEKSRVLNCRYHVLHGLLSPSEGIEPDMLNIKSLLERLEKGDIREVIMATDPSVTGEATAMYISRLIKPMNIKVTRLGYGIAVGSDLQYADEMTLSRSIEHRNEI